MLEQKDINMANEELEEYKVKQTQDNIQEIKTDVKSLSSMFQTFIVKWEKHEVEAKDRDIEIAKLKSCVGSNGGENKGIIGRIIALEGWLKIMYGFIICAGLVSGFVAWIIPLIKK